MRMRLTFENFQQVEETIYASEDKMRNFTQQHIANMVWSYAFFRRPGHHILDMMRDEVQARNLTVFKNGELSMTLWACAK